MTGIRTAIELTDQMTAPLMNIVNSLNLTISAFQNMQGASAGSIDTSEIEGAREQINQATMALYQMEEASKDAARAASSVVITDPMVHSADRSVPVLVEPIIPNPFVKQPSPVQVPVEWQVQSSIDVFDGNGIDRMSAEMSSLGSMTEDVLASQQRIGEQALKIDLLPPDAVWDINLTNQRIEELGEKLTNLQSQDISLVDDTSVSRLSSEFEGMRSNMNTVINLQAQMNQAIDDGDISALNAGYSQLNSVAEQVERKIRSTQATMDQMGNIQWQSPGNIEVFTGGGMGRYEQEIASVNQMLNQVTASQRRIANMSNQTDIFPDNMVADLQAMDSRIQRLRSSIEQIDSNPINDIGADAVNNDVERLRQQLDQAITSQNELSSAMERMDVSAANVAYNRLNNVVDNTDIHIRENINAQNQFNNSVQQGGSMMDGLKGKILATAGAYASIRTAGEVLNLSDTVSQTEARLNLIVDDGGSVEQLERRIFNSAQRSRAPYSDLANMVSKLEQNAGDAFASNDESIQFVENLNKQFVIAGASQQEVSSATLQLTQALGSGVLRGEELNAVFEAAPNVIQTIADYMDVPIGKVRELASDGEITAEVMKNALLSATDAINAEFNLIPATFSQAWTNIQNDLLMTFQPLIQTIGEGAEWIHQNWSTIEPIFWGLAAAVAAYALITGISAGVTWLSVAANQTLILTMLKNPVLWIALLIGFLISAIYDWVESIGGIRVAWLTTMNAIETAWDWVCIGFMTGVYWVLNLWDNLMLGISIASTAIQNFMGDMKAGVLTILQNMVNDAIGIVNDFIGVLNNIPGVSIDAIAEVTFGTAAQLENEVAKKARESDLQNYRDEIANNVLDRENAINSMKTDAIAATGQRQTEIDTIVATAKKQAEDDIPKQEDYAYTGLGTDSVPGNVGDIADNTGAMRDAVDISSEDLKYMRDLAEMEVVNRYTIAEIKIEQTNNNKISSKMDLDGVTSKLSEGLDEAIEIATEGVHD